MHTLHIQTNGREEMIDITSRLAGLLTEQNYQSGILTLFNPHTTSAITVNEGADPDVCRDIITSLRRIFPHKGDYLHAEGNSDAHLKTTLAGPSLQLIVEKGQICLGTWQRIFLMEFDGPRPRKIWAKWTGE